jgi:hypothetical protein
MTLANPQLAIRNPKGGGLNDPQIGMGWMQAGERVDFHNLRLAGFVAAEVDTSAIAPADEPPCLERNSLGCRDLAVIGRAYQTTIHDFLAMLFIGV